MADSDIACIHGGEHRMVLVTGKTDCTGLTASDDLGAFNWVCDNSIGTARMISTGLADGKYLSDLIDFPPEVPGFKSNAVTVSDSIGVWGTTDSSVWWINPVVGNNAGGTLDATTDSTIYLVTTDPQLTWNFFEDKLALVVQPGVTLTASGGIAQAVRLTNSDYLWFEGNIDATGNDDGVFLGNVRFSVLNNVVANNTDSGSANGIFLLNSSKNRLTDVTASNNNGGFNTGNGIFLDDTSTVNTLSNVITNNNGRNGLFLDNTSNNTLSGVTASNNARSGIRLDNATFNALLDLTVNNNGSPGVLITNTSNNNILSGVMASNNLDGIYIDNSSFNSLTDVTASNNNFNGIGLFQSSNNRFLVVIASNNGAFGVNLSASLDNTFAGVTVNSNNASGIRLFNDSDSNTLTGVTAGNNREYGVYIEASNNNTLLGVTASNQGTAGISLNGASFNTLSDLAVSNNATGVNLSSSSNNTFTGWLEVGSNSIDDCQVSGGPDPGLEDDTCAINGASNHIVVPGIDLTNAFVGKVLIDDALNDDDDDGAEAIFPGSPEAFDWTNFDNDFRGWGVDGVAFPNANHRGRWTTGGGRIWDWSVAIGDNGNAGNPALLNVLALPNGNNTLTHTWSDTSTTTILRNAVELPGDAIGNDDHLCESSEVCIYLPNIGSYQGHGDLVSAGAFTDSMSGGLTGITLMEYENNGR